jgi:acetylornithine/N-succinyldiaminopimelate aminotransferase
MAELFPGEATSALVARAATRFTPNYRQAPFILARGEGVWVWDRDGRRYLDMVGGIAVNSLGHAHPRLVRAISEQASAFIHVSNLYHHEPAIALLEKLTSISFADRVFFTNSGAESNEAALKLFRRYTSVVKGQPDRTHVLAFHHSFHGRTLFTVTATGQPKYHEGFAPLAPGVHHAHFGDMASVRAALDAAEGRIGAILVEPIQCEGGMRMPPAGFLRGLRELCDAEGMVLILDEVQTGVGRTGHWFAYQREGIVPDIMTLAKGLGGGVPVGAMLCREEVAQGFTPGSHATTFGGNALATRAALEVLRTIEDEGLLERVRTVGAELGEGLGGLVARFPAACVEARGVGLLWGLGLASDDLGKKVVEGALAEGLLLNAIGAKVIRFVPPLVCQAAEVRQALGILERVLRAAAKID